MNIISKYKMRVIKGICSKCASPRVTKSHCERHHLENQQRYRAQRGIPLDVPKSFFRLGDPRMTVGSTAVQKSLGLCYQCNLPAVNAKFCEYHRQARREWDRAWRNRAKGLPSTVKEKQPFNKIAVPVCEALDKHLSRIFGVMSPIEKEKPVSAHQRRTGQVKNRTTSKSKL